jgi:hypothetical protein
MTQPTPCGFGKDPTTGKDLSRIPECLFRYRLYEIYNDTLRYVAQSEGAFLIDLSRTIPKATKYYWDYVHYTDAGSEELAKIVTTALLFVCLTVKPVGEPDAGNPHVRFGRQQPLLFKLTSDKGP